jgi:hypothetical protein
MHFLTLRVRTAHIVHGYDSQNKELIEEFKDEPFVEKMIALSRIQSVSEKFVLVTSSHGRVMYWEYEGGMEALRRRLSEAGLLVP